MSVFAVILVCIFPHSDWIRRDTPYLSVFSPNGRKCGPELLRIRTLFTQCRDGVFSDAEKRNYRLRWIHWNSWFSLKTSIYGISTGIMPAAVCIFQYWINTRTFKNQIKSWSLFILLSCQDIHHFNVSSKLPLKMSENLCFPDVSRGYRNRAS